LQGLLARGELTFDTSGNITSVDQWATNTATGAITALVEGTDTSSNGYFDFTAEFIAGSTQDIEVDFGIYYSNSAWAKGTLATSQFASASNTAFQSANGYGAGDLQAVAVATDGAITGKYSNGEVIPLYRVGLAKFQNYQDLYKRGGNLFEETRNSGSPITGKPGSSGLGSISPNSLEQSNVDIAEQFVKMITTQRGFQANSKIITVTDQMLAELIQLKR
jgi:flagellar hook protein FlgE